MTNDDWVLANPFRAHVGHLCAATTLPWQVVGAAAGVPPRAMATLMHGRAGRYRPRVHRAVAHALLSLTPLSLAQRAREVVPGNAAGDLVRFLIDEGVGVAEIARHTGWEEHMVEDVAACRVLGVRAESWWRLQALAAARCGTGPWEGDEIRIAA